VSLITYLKCFSCKFDLIVGRKNDNEFVPMANGRHEMKLIKTIIKESVLGNIFTLTLKFYKKIKF